MNCGDRRPLIAVLWSKFGHEMDILAPLSAKTIRIIHGLRADLLLFTVMSNISAHMSSKLLSNFDNLEHVKKG